MDTLEGFDKKNGLIDCDRDLFLSIIQYINTITLRNYIGLSEETFARKNHRHYHIYRYKNNKIPFGKLITHPFNKFSYLERGVISGLRHDPMSF
jgi:hypothetical protein